MSIAKDTFFYLFIVAQVSVLGDVDDEKRGTKFLLKFVVSFFELASAPTKEHVFMPTIVVSNAI